MSNINLWYILVVLVILVMFHGCCTEHMLECFVVNVHVITCNRKSCLKIYLSLLMLWIQDFELGTPALITPASFHLQIRVASSEHWWHHSQHFSKNENFTLYMLSQFATHTHTLNIVNYIAVSFSFMDPSAAEYISY